MAGVFLNFKLWIPTAFKKDPLPNVEKRMQVFFWIKRKVYEPVSKEMKADLKIRWNPERKEPMQGNYLVKHYRAVSRKKVMVDGEEEITEKVVPVTQYKGSGIVYVRHAMRAKGGA